MTILVTKTSSQALRDIHRNFLNAICGTRWMRQQIRKGGIDKRVSFIESDRRRSSVLDAINSLNDTMDLTSCYYGYKYYKSKNNALYTFYAYKVKNTPYALIVSVDPNVYNATIVRVIVYSVENVIRILNGKHVTVDRENTSNFKTCSLKKDMLNNAILEYLATNRY